MDEQDSELPVTLSFCHGSVVDRVDPLKLGRIKANIPGIAEPTGWAFPLSMARGPGMGFWSIPKLNSEVGIWFKNGDEDQAFYVPSHWTTAAQPPVEIQGASVEDAPDIHVFETEKWALILDDRATPLLTLKDKAGLNSIEIDGLTQGITIKGTVAVRIEATGTVTIDGAIVKINNRVVLPTGRPI